MVLEHLVPEEWLERRALVAFGLGALYSIIGITLARLIFASDPALAAVAFTSILILPALYKLFAIEAKQQKKELKSGLRVFWKDTGDFYRVLLCLFLGILLVYCVAAMVLPSLSVNSLFREQLEMRATPGFGAVGGAFRSDLFSSILTNNAVVMTAVFIVAFLAGDGAILLITWNASVWGTIFGVTARNAAVVTQGNPFLNFIQIVLTVTPHVLLEASAYILMAMAGGLLSRALVQSGWRLDRLGREVSENATIIGLAIACLVLGAAVESLVLNSSLGYRQLIELSLSTH